MGERFRKILRWMLGGDAVETVRLGPDDHGGVAVPVSELPEDLRVGGNVTLECCTRLVELPSGVEVGGSMVVRRCPIERLGERVQIKGISDWSMSR